MISRIRRSLLWCLLVSVPDCLLGSLCLGPESWQATGRAHWEAARARPGDTLFMWHSLVMEDKN